MDKLGITINGNKPYDVQVNDPKAIENFSGDLSLAAGEAYMDGAWDCDQLDELFNRVTGYINSESTASAKTKIAFYLAHVFSNLQSVRRSKQVAEQHYNLGQTMYQTMLGPSMAYTCAYWKDAANLDEAQNEKYDLVCRKIQLKPGERLLDLGCGFGGLSIYAAKHFGAKVVGVNIATDQIDFARRSAEGLDVEFFDSDYRHSHIYNASGIPFDKVASVGLCEHIGTKNLATYVQTMRSQLKEDGLALLHTIGKNITSPYTDPWIRKYIFPHGSLPSLVSLTKAIEGRFTIEDIQNIGLDYDKTLMAWYENFNNGWDQLKGDYDERFYRMFRYYLLSCAGGFRSRSMQLWQLLLSPNGTPEVSSYVR
jgi:cyclopropane-fatty-acyl-phospholipid synthase